VQILVANRNQLPSLWGWRFIFILFSHLYLSPPSGFFPSNFYTTNMCALLLSPIHDKRPANLTLLDLITQVIIIIISSSAASWFCKREWILNGVI
jgi:hypothetical protein